jgi:hypothetical protein
VEVRLACQRPQRVQRVAELVAELPTFERPGHVELARAPCPSFERQVGHGQDPEHLSV